MPQTPLISVIIVNYNGKTFLQHCLDSVLNQSLAKSKYEIIVVDNNSSDNSVSFIKRNFPQIKLVESSENLGFAGGNNLGVTHAQGKYIVLLNNDTKVDRQWLAHLLSHIESDTSIAAVNAKSLLYYPFVQVEIESDNFMKAEFTESLDFRSVGVAIEEVFTHNPSLQRMIQYYQGFYKRENDQGTQIPIRWTNGKGILLVAIDPDKTKARYFITVRGQKNTSNLVTNLRIKVGDQILVEDTLKAQEVKQFSLDLVSNQLKSYLLHEVQNAGNVVFKTAHSRDRGAVVGNKQQYFEVDNDYFNQPTNVNAFCGVSVIIRKDVFTQLGGFDDSFFMYYEDVDLSLRMQRAGYKLRYEPKAVLHHIHAGSSGEWSPFFIYNVEKNHLAVAAKHFPWPVVINEVLRYYALLAVSYLKMWKWRASEHWQIYEDWKERVEIRQKVIHWFWQNILTFVRFRHQQKEAAVISLEALFTTYY